MNAKIESPEPEYIHEDEHSSPWIKSKPAKLIGIIGGGVLALVASFGIGVAVGHEVNPKSDHIAGFDRDGGHKFPGAPRPPHHEDQEHGHGDFQMPEPSATPEVQNN